MSQESTPQTPSGLTTPFAIIIAGALIAVAVYAGGKAADPSPQAASDVPAAGTAQQAGTPGNTAAAEITFRDITDEDHIRGGEDAKVTILEYSDIECPFCKKFHPTLERVMEEYGDDVRWVYRHFPLESIHPQARPAAIATECADDQGKFWELLDYLFVNTTTGADLAEDKLIAAAVAVNIPNQATFTSCLEAKTHDDIVTADIADAQKAGARGTPYTVLIGPDGEKKVVSGAQGFEAVKAQIDTLLGNS